MRFEHEVRILIPFHNAPIKYQSHAGYLYVERFLSTSMHYPCHVGEILHTANNNDLPLTALLMTPQPLQSGCHLQARAIGVLAMQNHEGDCSKILMVPSDRLTDNYEHVANFSDVHPLFLEQIKHFFTHYEGVDGENGLVCTGWLSAEEAVKRINAGMVGKQKLSA